MIIKTFQISWSSWGNWDCQTRENNEKFMGELLLYFYYDQQYFKHWIFTALITIRTLTFIWWIKYQRILSQDWNVHCVWAQSSKLHTVPTHTHRGTHVHCTRTQSSRTHTVPTHNHLGYTSHQNTIIKDENCTWTQSSRMNSTPEYNHQSCTLYQYTIIKGTHHTRAQSSRIHTSPEHNNTLHLNTINKDEHCTLQQNTVAVCIMCMFIAVNTHHDFMNQMFSNIRVYTACS